MGMAPEWEPTPVKTVSTLPAEPATPPVRASTQPTVWVHELSDADTEIGQRLLWWAWRQHGPAAPLDRYVLATVLGELGVQWRDRGLADAMTVQRLVDMAGWLNAPKDCPGFLERPPVVRVPWWRRWRSR